MSELYELNRDKTKYNNLKYSLNKIYDILSSADLRGDLSYASTVLQKNYIIDNASKYSKSISTIVDTINNNRGSINSIIRDINTKINNINNEIRELDQ